MTAQGNRPAFISRRLAGRPFPGPDRPAETRWAARSAALLLVAALAAPAAGQEAPGPRGPATATRAEFPGVLMPARTALVKSRYDDRLAEVVFPVGRRVRRGQLLLRFADDEHRIEVERAAALHDRAAAFFRRAEELRQQETLSQEEFEKAETSLRLAKADLELARVRLRERSIVAPFDGVVAERYVDPGASVKSGDPLIRVTATSPLRVETLLPESMLTRLRKAPVVHVALASPDTTLILRVNHAPVVVDPSSGMFPLQIEVDNSRGRLVPGVSCRVRIPEPARTGP